jgi:outer membrane protein TolC
LTNAASATYQALNESVTANRRALEISNELYSKCLGDFLNVLDSERSLFGSEDQLVDSQRTVTENLVALYKALGGGWQTPLLAQNDRRDQ